MTTLKISTEPTVNKNTCELLIMLKLVEKEVKNASAELSNIYAGDLCFISNNENINNALRQINELAKQAHRLTTEALGIIHDVQHGEIE